MTAYTEVRRTRVIRAASEDLLPFLIDFHRWIDWSPWEGLDPNLRRTYGEIERGVGATYAWAGNRKAGAGRMRITSTSEDRVDVDVQFTRPFPSSSSVTFALAQVAEGTQLAWTLRSPKTLASRVFGLIMNMDKAIGKDLERGLERLQRAVEG
jgi:hypothetical protein